MKTLRIFIADDHEITRLGLRALLEAEPGWEVCGEAADGRAALAMLEQLRPDVAIVDLAMPGLNGIEVTMHIRRSHPEGEVIIFTGTEDEEVVHRAFAAGARACVLKSEGGRHIVPAVRAVAEHRPYLGSHTAQIVFDRYLSGGGPAEATSAHELTVREREILQLLAEGSTNKDAATALGVSIKTVETHRAAIMRKLALDSFSDLVRYAIRHHIIEP